ncbi:hypothetical protein [Streptomyces halstedii]|nr:hypothetical protein [Streptomyces halstedii]
MENFFTPKKIWKNGGPFPHVLSVRARRELEGIRYAIRLAEA